MKPNFSDLKDNKKFSSSMEKMTLNIPLKEEEVEFILSSAILLLKAYSVKKEDISLFEIAYYIVLKVAINNAYYTPLLDISANFGLYPISKYILENELTSKVEALDFALNYNLNNFRYNEIVETFEQKKYRTDIVSSQASENCYIAPTSFGKSSLIVEIIKSNAESRKISIIVPTKSLLIQTYKLIKNNFSQTKIIFHDEMYDNSDAFISVFTQERALRLLKKYNISFDLLVIDEAHKIFEMSSRSILLTRLIRRNRFRNPNSKNYYLSPLISDSNNLKTNHNQLFFERRIVSNIKEADIFEYRQEHGTYKYNRFLNNFYPLTREGKADMPKYIIDNSKNKNFLYLNTPRKVEKLAAKMALNLPVKECNDLEDLSRVISNNVHREFYCVDYIKKGLLYIHGKLPDLIKEYLEYCFTKHNNLKFIVANSVILEGINLPIDSLFILNTDKMNEKDLINLIGRVNRLNEVFLDKNKSLNKLSPSIHFVNSDEFHRKGGKMENKIKLLGNNVFKDEIDNPLLINFDDSELEHQIQKEISNADKNKKINDLKEKIDYIERLRNRENFIIFGENDPAQKIMRVLTESELGSNYNDHSTVFKILEHRIQEIKNDPTWVSAHVIDKIYKFFIQGLEQYISSEEFSRLRNDKARAFYKMFTENLHRLNLKEHISEMLKYFISIKHNTSGKAFYIGISYGEISKFNETTKKYGAKSYIDLSKKNDRDLVNIALVKIKMESDFVSYTLNEYINVLFELGLISEEEYNRHIYGTESKSNSDFVKIGLSGSLVNRLEKDKQIKNLSISDFGRVDCNDEFRKYIKIQDGLTQFEIGKFINLD